LSTRHLMRSSICTPQRRAAALRLGRRRRRRGRDRGRHRQRYGQRCRCGSRNDFRYEQQLCGCGFARSDGCGRGCGSRPQALGTQRVCRRRTRSARRIRTGSSSSGSTGRHAGDDDGGDGRLRVDDDADGAAGNAIGRSVCSGSAVDGLGGSQAESPQYRPLSRRTETRTGKAFRRHRRRCQLWARRRRRSRRRSRRRVGRRRLRSGGPFAFGRSSRYGRSIDHQHPYR
jgi:hypothetical protein